MSLTAPCASPVSVKTRVPMSDVLRSRISLMSGTSEAGRMLERSVTTTASRPNDSISSVGTTCAEPNRPPSSTRSPATDSLVAPRMTSLTSPSRTPSARLRIGRPMSRLPLRMVASSRGRDQVDVDNQGGQHDQHEQHEGGEPALVRRSLQAHQRTSVGATGRAMIAPARLPSAPGAVVVPGGRRAGLQTHVRRAARRALLGAEVVPHRARHPHQPAQRWRHEAADIVALLRSDDRLTNDPRPEEPERLRREPPRAMADDRQTDNGFVERLGGERGEDPATEPRRPHAGPAVPVSEQDATVGPRYGAERRQVVGRDVDRTAPRVDERHVVEHREDAPEATRREGDGSPVAFHPPAETTAVASPASATAERDPAVSGRPEVVVGEAAVRDR